MRAVPTDIALPSQADIQHPLGSLDTKNVTKWEQAFCCCAKFSFAGMPRRALGPQAYTERNRAKRGS